MQLDQAVVQQFDPKIFANPSLRTLIIGPSGSGKTTLLTKVIYPAIQDKFHLVYIITVKKNEKTYLDMLPKNKFITEEIISPKGEVIKKKTKIPYAIFKFPQSPFDIDNYISEMLLYQEKTERRYNILLIYDDVYSTQLKSSDKFVQQFTNFRQYNISVFFLIQTLTELFSNTILNNLSYMIFFQQNTTYLYSRVKTQYIEPAIIKFWSSYYKLQYEKTQGKTKLQPILQKKEVGKIAEQIYTKYLILREHSALIYDVERHFLFHT